MTTTKEALEAVETSLDILEDQLDVLGVPSIQRIRLVKLGKVALVVGGISAVGYAGYRLGVHRTTLKYEDILTEEIAAAKAFHTRLAKKGDFETPESAVEALVPDEVVEAVQSYQGRGSQKVPYNRVQEIVQDLTEPKVEVAVETVSVTQNVFAESRTNLSDWDYDKELAERDPSKPYVISLDEFNENVEHNEQTVVSYYELDDTLVDERDQPIDNTEYLVGDDNLTRFGHGSNDRNVVYIRNEKISTDFEVILSKGSYATEVLGIDPPELRHSRRRPNRRHWSADE